MAPLSRAASSVVRSSSKVFRPTSVASSPIKRQVSSGQDPTQQYSPSRGLCTTSARQAGDSSHEHHEDHYDPPGGWLWGIPPGQKYEKEGWEGLFTYGFYGSLILAVIAYGFKPDTSIETWALEEAKRRLQAEGTLPEEE